MPINQRKTTPGIPLHSEFKGGESDTIREIPPEWRAALDLTVEEIPMPWDRPIFDLSDTILASKAEQQYTSERKMRTTVKPPGVFFLYESYTDKHKQLGVRERSFHFIDDWPSAVPSPSALMDVETRNFGNKHFELRQELLPGLFTAEEFCSERPTVTPPDFRALLGEHEHCFIDFGTATLPPDPLPTGIIKWCDNQEDVYTHKVCITSLDLLGLPKTINNKETNARKQFVAVDRTLELDTTIPSVPTALMDVEFTKLGDGTALEIHKTVPEVFDEHRIMRERPVVTPEDFRALLTEKEEDQVLTGTAITDPFPLPAGYVRHSLERNTEFTYKDSVRTIDLLSLPKENDNSVTNRFKQVETVKRILELDTTTPFLPTSTRDVEFTKLGDGTALEIRREVPIRFPESKWTRERPVVTPTDFRALLTELETSSVFAGTAGDPGAPPVGVIRHDEEQVDVFNMRDVLRTIDILGLPAFRHNKETNQFKQVVNVTRTLELDSSTPALPTATKDVEFTQLGDGTALQIEKDSGTVFGRAKWTRERPIVTPTDFRALLTELETSLVSTGIAADPGVPPVGVLRHEEEQVDVFNMRDTLRTIDTLSLPKTNTNKETNRFKQVVTVDRILELDTTTPLAPTALIDVEFTKLGDGTALEVRKTVPLVFPQTKYTRERPIVTPSDFRALLTEKEVSSVFTGIAVDPGVPPAGTLRHEEEQVDVFNMRDILRTIDTSTLPRTNTNKETNRFKQVVTVDRILELDTSTPLTPTDVMDVEFTKLGDGTALEIRKTVPIVFNELTATIEIADLVPEIFKAVIPITSEEYVASGTTINDPPILATGDLFREEKRETEQTVRIRHRGRAGITYPQTVVASGEVGGERFGGEVLQTVATIDTIAHVPVPFPDTGVNIVSSQVRNLGNGTWVKNTQSLAIASAWPTLLDNKFDKETQLRTIIERQTVDPAYTIPTLPSYASEDVTAIDKYHYRRTRITKNVSAHNSPATALLSYRYHPFKFPGTLDYNRLLTYDHREGYRRAAALLSKHTVRTWWLLKTPGVPPTLGPSGSGMDVEVDEIITDTVNVPIFAPNNSTEAQTYPEVLHDNITNTLGAFYPATTPSLTDYLLGTASSTTGSYGVAISVFPYGTGYHVGQVVTAGGYSFTVTNIGSAGELFGVVPNTTPSGNIIITGATNLGNFAITGGGTLNVYQLAYAVATPGSRWVGSERVVSAIVTQTDIPNLWKIVTEAVVMR